MTQCFWGAVGMVLAVAAAGCGRSSDAATETATAVYVCRETGAVLVAPVQETPALNSATGRRTLMPGLYCPTCRRWYPAPPVDVLQRMPGGVVCPKHKTPLQTRGPRP